MNQDFWSDERVFDKIKKLGLNNREALAFTNINPENFDILNKRDSDLEKKWAKLTLDMIDYYSISQIYLWIGELISIASNVQYSKNENFYKFLNKITPTQKKYYKHFKNLGLNFEDILKHYNINLVKNRTICPFHKGENDTSFQVDFNKQRFKCWSCGLSGNLIKFIDLMEDKNGYL